MHYALETDTVLWRQNFTHIIPDDDDDGYGTWCWRRGTWEWFPPRDRWLWGTICPLSLLPHPPCTWEQWGPVLLFPTSDASLASSSALSSCSLNAGLSIIFLGFACCCQSVSFCIFIRCCLFCHFSLYFLSRAHVSWRGPKLKKKHPSFLLMPNSHKLRKDSKNVNFKIGTLGPKKLSQIFDMPIIK